MRLTSCTTYLEVTAERELLAMHFAVGPATSIPVTIRGFIEGPHNHDDGKFQSFTVNVSEAIADFDPHIDSARLAAAAPRMLSIISDMVFHSGTAQPEELVKSAQALIKSIQRAQ